MFCTKCGNEINETEAFCSYCGAPVDAEGTGSFSTESAAFDSNPYASTVSSVKNIAYSPGMERSSYIVQNGVGMIVAFPLFIVELFEYFFFCLHNPVTIIYWCKSERCSLFIDTIV